MNREYLRCCKFQSQYIVLCEKKKEIYYEILYGQIAGWNIKYIGKSYMPRPIIPVGRGSL